GASAARRAIGGERARDVPGRPSSRHAADLLPGGRPLRLRLRNGDAGPRAGRSGGLRPARRGRGGAWLQRGRPRRRDGRPHQGRSRRPGRGGDRSPRRRRAPPRDGRAGARGGRERVRRAAPDRPHAGGLRTSALAPRGTPAVSADGTPDGAPPRRILVRLRDEWAGERGLFASDPRVRTLRRVLVSYPEVRHFLHDIISLEGVVEARVVDTMNEFLMLMNWTENAVLCMRSDYTEYT